MSEPLNPDLARALQDPARLVRADPALLEEVRRAGSPAQAELERRVSDAETVEDRYAAAAMLAALFDHRGPLDQTARGYGGTPPTELLDLADVPALRPALRQALSSPVRTGLLEWATTADPSRPPLELAMAARDLGVRDAAVLRSVADRADQVARQDSTGTHRGPLTRFSEVLRQAADAGGGDAAASSTGSGSWPSAQAPGAGSGPAVTTTGIPASEMLREDEQRDSDSAARTYPGDGVPVRDSIAGPGADPAGNGSPSGRNKIFDADRFWPMGPRRTDGAGGTSAGDDDVAPPATVDGPAERPGPTAPPREPSTNDLYHGAGSDRWVDRRPQGEEARAEEKNVIRNWAITFAVIVAIIVMLVLVL
ncbi:hypothetical protein [Kocuria sp.]|uniref:hypothetical protein n=1 Tax=Kocuria sp. TaxID=1871328 RepID=UPI0026DB30FA|nr:hypothetical protein [Kocuria sp.]MDO4918008.1 hypothetical protein [Kocuria sp.]